MAREINFNFEQYDGQIGKSCMDRMRAACGEIQLQAILKCKVGTINRPAVGPAWTEREAGAMRRTIRVVEKNGENGLVGRDVRVYVGNYKTWYAVQMEYGRGGWKGGARPFLRPAMQSSKSKVQAILESGAGQTKGA